MMWLMILVLIALAVVAVVFVVGEIRWRVRLRRRENEISRQLRKTSD
jgi:type II secretory pathway component PulK